MCGAAGLNKVAAKICELKVHGRGTNIVLGKPAVNEGWVGLGKPSPRTACLQGWGGGYLLFSWRGSDSRGASLVKHQTKI